MNTNTLERLNAVIDYVEKHITEEIDLNHLAGIACSSTYNFQRMFTFITEMSIVEYIRKRRLTLAGLELQQDGIRVMDAAIKYGYDSPVSFARAFQAFHGIMPSEAKKSDVILKQFPRINFQIFIKEVNEVKIVEKEEIFLCGFLVESTGGNLWEKYEKETEIHEQPELIDWSAYEVRFYPAEGERIFTACRQKEKVISPYYELLSVPSALYAVFDIDHKISQGPQFAEINKWLDENKDTYKRFLWDADGRISACEFVICRYDHQGKFGKDRIMEMWIPLVKVTG
jgi:AraC-like DNA-binding protein/predicted transcriptional regulator YdeE